MVGAAGVAWIGLAISSHEVGAVVCMGYRVLVEVLAGHVGAVAAAWGEWSMAHRGEGVLGTGVIKLEGE